MLIRITNACTMGCSHCMVDATPDGAHMSEVTFGKALGFAWNVTPHLLLLSGGEPTLHPQLLAFVDVALATGFTVAVLSNGLFLHDPEKAREVLSRPVLVQVTNDARFYPRRVPDFDLPAGARARIEYEREIRVVGPFGRALRNKVPMNQAAPGCFNLRSLVFGGHAPLFDAMSALRACGRWCIPSINVDGTIVAGESPSCYRIGALGDSDLELTLRLRSAQCNACGLVDQLDHRHRRAIGESLIDAV